MLADVEPIDVEVAPGGVVGYKYAVNTFGFLHIIIKGFIFAPAARILAAEGCDNLSVG